MPDFAVYAGKTPDQMRRLFRTGDACFPTAGLCPGHTQCNLIILPRREAEAFEVFARLNPLACPVLERIDAGCRIPLSLAPQGDVATDFPLYRVYRNGVLTEETRDVSHLWQPDLVSFLIGCSFSFEEALAEAGIPIRHIEEGCNVPMFRTNISCVPHGPFSGKMVVSMRPMSPEQAQRAAEITARMPRVHGAPIHIGQGAELGIEDVSRPDFGDAVPVKEGEVCVFWPCGVTPQSVVMESRPPFAMTHAPGHMLICDIKNRDLMEG